MGNGLGREASEMIMLGDLCVICLYSKKWLSFVYTDSKKKKNHQIINKIYSQSLGWKKSILSPLFWRDPCLFNILDFPRDLLMHEPLCPRHSAIIILWLSYANLSHIFLTKVSTFFSYLKSYFSIYKYL